MLKGCNITTKSVSNKYNNTNGCNIVFHFSEYRQKEDEQDIETLPDDDSLKLIQASSMECTDTLKQCHFSNA